MFLFLVFLSLISESHDLEGTWKGVGVAYDTNKAKTQCSAITYHITSLPETNRHSALSSASKHSSLGRTSTAQAEILQIKSEIVCGGKPSLSLEGELLLKANQLYYKNNLVGKIEGTRFEIQIRDHHQTLEVTGSLASPKKLQMIEIHTYRPLPDYFYAIEADLVKQENKL